MRATHYTLLVLALGVCAASAEQILGAAPVRENSQQLSRNIGQEESLLYAEAAQVPENHESNLRQLSNFQDLQAAPMRSEQETPTEHESTFSRALRAFRSPDTMNKVLRAAGFGNSFEDAKKIVSIDTDGSTATFSYGTNNPVSIVTRLTLSESAAYVYGKECAQLQCRKTPPKQIYDQTQTGGAEQPGEFTYGALKGKNWLDTVALTKDDKISARFGVITSGTPTVDINDGADALFGLGFGPTTANLDALFQLGPDPLIAIYRAKDSAKGQLVVGNNSHPNCGTKLSNYYDTVKDGNDQKWWIKLDTITVGEINEKDKTVGFDLSSAAIALPKNYIDALKKATADDLQTEDLTKVPVIKIVVGTETYELTPEDLTIQDPQTKKYRLQVITADGAHQANIVLGAPFIKKYCVTLSGKDNKYQVAFSIPQAEGSAAGLGVSLVALLMVPVLHLFRL